MKHLEPITLSGKIVNLEPLQEFHREELREIAQDETIWTYFSYNLLGENFDRGFNKALAGFQKHEQLPFAVRRRSDNKIIGSTRFYDIKFEYNRLCIGHTFYISVVRGTQVNPECKFLLLQHAFEILNINRVEFAINARNVPSCAAVKKLGATEEGILRQHMVMESGFIRDTAVYSILKQEWDHVKKRLQARLSIPT